MLAFSGYFGAGEKNICELGEIRKKRWTTLLVRLQSIDF